MNYYNKIGYIGIININIFNLINLYNPKYLISIFIIVLYKYNPNFKFK